MGTAELAILVSGTVGLGAPTISALFQKSRDKGVAQRERAARDRDELRALLDEIAAALDARTEQLVESEQWMRESFLHRSKSDEAPDVEPSKGTHLSTLKARLVIRRGRRDTLTAAFEAYIDTTDQALEEIGSMWRNHEPFDFDDARLDERAARYRRALEVFLDRAKAILDAN